MLTTTNQPGDTTNWYTWPPQSNAWTITYPNLDQQILDELKALRADIAALTFALTVKPAKARRKIRRGKR